MKVIHLALGKLDRANATGVERVVHELASAMTRTGADVEVWGITPDTDVEESPRPYPLRLFKPARFSLFPAAELCCAIDEMGCAHGRLDTGVHFHFHGELSPQFAVVARRLAQLGLPYSISLHDAHSREAGLKRAPRRNVSPGRIERRLMQGSVGLHVSTQAEASELRQVLPGASVYVIPDSPAPAALSLVQERDRLTFACCTRLDLGTSGLDLLVAAFSEYATGEGTGRLLLLGDGPDQRQIELMTRHLGDHVELLGDLEDGPRVELLRGAHAFVHTSRDEGVSLAAIEAAALGLPIVLGRGTAHAEAVERWDAGFVFELDASESITATLHAVERRWDAGTLADVGERARDLAAAELSWEAVAARIACELYAPAREPRSVA